MAAEVHRQGEVGAQGRPKSNGSAFSTDQIWPGSGPGSRGTGCVITVQLQQRTRQLWGQRSQWRLSLREGPGKQGFLLWVEREIESAGGSKWHLSITPENWQTSDRGSTLTSVLMSSNISLHLNPIKGCLNKLLWPTSCMADFC